MDEEINTIKDQFNDLPAEVRQAVTSFNWPAKLKEIGDKNTLHIDQVGKLENEVMLVILGTIAPDDFANQLRKNSGIPEDKISAVIADSNEMIFKPIRQALAKIYEENLTDADLEIPATAENTMESAGVEVLNNTQPTAPKLTSDKMAAPFHLPKQETNISITKSTPDSKDLPSPGVMPKMDPYREKPI